MGIRGKVPARGFFFVPGTPCGLGVSGSMADPRPLLTLPRCLLINSRAHPGWASLTMAAPVSVAEVPEFSGLPHDPAPGVLARVWWGVGGRGGGIWGPPWISQGSGGSQHLWALRISGSLGDLGISGVLGSLEILVVSGEPGGVSRKSWCLR